MKMEYDTALMSHLKDGVNITFNVNGWPLVDTMTIPRKLWPSLPSEYQSELKANPPKENHGKPGKPHSVSPKCWSGDADDYEYNGLQGHHN